MSRYQPPSETFDSGMMISSEMADHIDPSNLMPFQASDTDWVGKEPFILLPWDMSLDEQPFDLQSDYVVDIQPRASYATSNLGSPDAFKGYMIKQEAPEDVLSYSSPISVRYLMRVRNTIADNYVG
jgi:hypothetical protein